VIREIQEETGIKSDQLIFDNFDETKPAFSLSYETTNKHGQTINKTSTYYALEMKNTNPLTVLNVPIGFIQEISDIRIVREDEVRDILSHDNEKKYFTTWLQSIS
jgi:hypothetical protein